MLFLIAGKQKTKKKQTKKQKKCNQCLFLWLQLNYNLWKKKKNHLKFTRTSSQRLEASLGLSKRDVWAFLWDSSSLHAVRIKSYTLIKNHTHFWMFFTMKPFNSRDVAADTWITQALWGTLSPWPLMRSISVSWFWQN